MGRDKNFVGVIPARFASTRFPGKPLAQIYGRPMIAWVVERALKAKSLSKIIVATDHDEIATVAQAAGADVVMTPPDLPTGSDRVYWSIRDLACDYVINIQGDEPLLAPEMLEALVELLRANKDADMATLGRKASRDDLSSPTTAKIVVDQSGRALYFSRFAIPYSRQLPLVNEEVSGCLKHIGIYGYKKEFLARFCQTAPCEIEKLESLEQLRALYLGARIHVKEVSFDSWGVDRPEDIQKVEELMARVGY